MVYVYKNSDKEKKNPIPLREGVRFKSLWNKAQRIADELDEYFLTNNLMFEGEDYETRKHIYKAIDELRAFRHNLRLKDSFCEE